MNTVETILIILLVLDAIALGGLVLIQQGKGADVGAAFGSGGANTLFGSAGSASFLTKITAWLAIAFFAISFGLAYTAKERARSLGDFDVGDIIEEPALPDDVPTGDLPPTPDSDSDIPAL